MILDGAMCIQNFSVWTYCGKKTVNSRKAGILGIIVLLSIMLLAILAAKPVYSANGIDEKEQEITLVLRPLTIIDYSLGPGEEFDVNISVSNVAYLHGFQARLTYDSALVECRAVQEGDLLDAFGNTTVFSPAINNTLGYVYMSLNLTSSEAMANGNGTLAKLRFQAMNRGETTLRLSQVNLYDSKGASLPYVTYDCYFNNRFLFDVGMPLTLFSVTVASLLLNQKTESKLKVTLEDKEFKTKDAVMLVALMAVMISSIALLRQLVAPLMILFLFSYSTLLFIFTYLFSKRHWYIALIPPAVFVLLYAFLRDTLLWSNFLVPIYAVVFAILITLYVSSLFAWKPMLVFAMLLTIVDIILVLVTGTMIQVADTAFRGLSLPEMVAVPIVPPLVTTRGWLQMALGLGDFFFAGLLGIQTFKKYDRKIAIISILAMAVSFFTFETILLSYWKIPFPGTVMIMCGWLPVAIGKALKDRVSKANRERPDGAS
jgi:hypothetical protein